MNSTIIEHEILNMIGLSIVNGRIYDVDTGRFLTFNGNYICTSDAPIVHKRDIPFDLLGNPKLAEYFLNVLISKDSQDNGLVVKVISIAEEVVCNNPYIARRVISITTNAGGIQTSYFFNICLGYIEMMYLLTGTPMSFDLHSFDLTLELVKELQTQRTKKE